MDGGRRPAIPWADLRVHGAQLAQFAAARQLIGLDEIRAVTPLRPRLINAAEAQKRVGQRAALRDRH